MQKVRSFKIRGAYYAIHQLSEEDKKRGVVCASAGNHAQGVAFSAQKLGVKAVICMPATTPILKVEATKFTEVGYVGRDVESIVRDLVETSVRMVRQQKIEDVQEKARECRTEAGKKGRRRQTFIFCPENFTATISASRSFPSGSRRILNEAFFRRRLSAMDGLLSR